MNNNQAIEYVDYIVAAKKENEKIDQQIHQIYLNDMKDLGIEVIEYTQQIQGGA